MVQVERLCDRVQSSTLLEDRRDAVRALKSLSKVVLYITLNTILLRLQFLKLLCLILFRSSIVVFVETFGGAHCLIFVEHIEVC